MVGQTVQIKIKVDDQHGGIALQEYELAIIAPVSDKAPIFISDPKTNHYVTDNTGSSTGSVSHDQLNLHINTDEIIKQIVSMNVDEHVPMVDIFLTFDSTGSFRSFARSLVIEFPKIIEAITEALPGVSFAFGVGMFQGYYNTDRPFTLNQPIITTDTDGFTEAINAALNSYRSGNGQGYQTVVEALYQIATGKGFDGNNDGDTTDSGSAGLRETQMNPGAGGDVPSFDSFVPDPENNVLAPSGTIGGVGFRNGVLPIIIAASDVPFIFQPDGSDEVHGANDSTISMDYFNGFLQSTPEGRGATIQEAIDALRGIGAIVIGMGTERARKGMEALSILTGGVNGGQDAVDTGTGYSIAPDDPYFFPVLTNNASQTANGIIAAIKSAMVNTRHDIEVIASRDGVPFANLTGVIKNVLPGEIVSFDLSLLGDGLEHSFDIQFVKAGTGVILASIPVTINTTYQYDAEAIDPLGGEITYSLTGNTFGAVINQETGLINWNPVGNGLYIFTVVATDSRGNSTEQIYEVAVGNRPQDAKTPNITGLGETQAEVGRLFVSKIVAESPNDQAMTYFVLKNAPDGLSVDRNTGTISWTPGTSQEGDHEFTIRAVSSEGASAEMLVAITVIGWQIDRNTKPIFITTPKDNITPGHEYRYVAEAQDREGDQITLRLLMSPEGMVFDPSAGILAWIPDETQLGDHQVIIQADDGQGGLNTQAFTISHFDY